MGEATETNRSRINLRLQKSAKELIERAASFRGKTVSNFILASAVKEAEETIAKHESMVLAKKDAQAFLDALSMPVSFNDALQDALAEHESRVISE